MAYHECMQCHTPRKPGNALVLIGVTGDLRCDLLWSSKEGDKIFCSPVCMLAFVESGLDEFVIDFVERQDRCQFCEKPVARGVAFCAPYESALDTIGAGMAHVECFMKVLKQDAKEFREQGLKPWFRTGHELPEHDPEPLPRRSLADEMEQVAKNHEGNPRAIATHGILRLLGM